MLSRPFTCKWRNKVWWMMGWLVRLKAAELLMQTDAEVLLKTISTCDVLNFQGKREFCWGNTLLCMLLYVWKEVSVFWFIAYRRIGAVFRYSYRHCCHQPLPSCFDTNTLFESPSRSHPLNVVYKPWKCQFARSSDKLCFPTLNGGKGVCVGQRHMAVITMSRIINLASLVQEPCNGCNYFTRFI